MVYASGSPRYGPPSSDGSQRGELQGKLSKTRHLGAAAG